MFTSKSTICFLITLTLICSSIRQTNAGIAGIIIAALPWYDITKYVASLVDKLTTSDEKRCRNSITEAAHKCDRIIGRLRTLEHQVGRKSCCYYALLKNCLHEKIDRPCNHLVDTIAPKLLNDRFKLPTKCPNYYTPKVRISI